MKRIVDFLFASLFLGLASPVIFIVSIILYFSLGRPIIFYQERVGLHERVFVLYKFRTMKNIRDDQGHLLSDCERLTRVGSILRRLSLDELPQLINVLKGDMSLIGPRPLVKEYLPYYTERERLRHTVRPGITGLAQISGRNKLNWDERLELDAKYVEEYDFLLDIKILFITMVKVFRRDDIIVDPRTFMKDLDEERKEMMKD